MSGGAGEHSAETDALREAERRLREQLNETMIAAQGALSEDRCEVLHSESYQCLGHACVECVEYAADLLPDSFDEQVVRAFLEPLDVLYPPGQAPA